MASGLTEVEKLIIELSKQNQTLQDLINENTRLNETIFQETGKERIDKLIKSVEDKNDILKKVIDAVNNDLHLNINFDTLTQDLKDFKTKIKETEQLIQDELDTKAAGYRDRVKNLRKLLKQQTESYNLLESSASDYYQTANKGQEELNKRQLEGITILDDKREKWEQRTRAFTKGIKEITGGVQQINTAVGKTLEPWRKANQETMSYAKSVGMSQKSADAYLTKTVSWAAKNNIGILFNKSTDELIKLQGKYSEVLGRNVHLTSEQKKDMLAMEAFLGEEGTMDIANNLENFGLGMTDAAEFVKETIDDATKSGIHAAKLTKLVRENIKMAQNYTFKDGLKGLENMAKKAAALKTDMSLVSSFADKVSTVEGAIETGAKLQVLGGSYALGSDPLSMLYESLNDMEGLFDRAVGMAKGKVYYNEQTGNFEMGAMDRYLMKQAAQSMGVDYTKMTDVAFRQASLGRIENQALMNSNISGDKEMLELVKNLATFENGRAVIDIGGKKVDVGSGLTADHKAQLEQMQMTDSENLQSMAISLRSMNDIMSGTQKEINNEQANATHGIASSLNKMLRNNEALLNKVGQIGAWANILSGGWKTLLGIWGSVNGILRSMYGVRNVISGKPATLAGNTPKGGISRFKGQGLRETIVTSSTGKKYRDLGNGTLESLDTGKRVKVGTGVGQVRVASTARQWTGLAKTLGSGAKAGAGLGAISAGLHLGTAAITGEDMVGAARKGAVSLAGNIIGGAIGSLIPGGTVIGAMIGGMVAEGINAGITKVADKKRNEIRDSIYDELISSMPNVAKLFSGPDALKGNYRVKQLNQLKEAMSDGTLDKSEVSRNTRRMLRKNGDLELIQNAGVTVSNIEMAKGGYLNGPSHIDGGMPILGSNISVEGGEYVINKEATKQNLPLLEKINSGNIKISPREPLGKQMRVHDYSTYGSDMPHNKGKMEMSPISLNISGTIKLDMGGGHNVDITKQLLNEPKFITELTNMISKQMNIYDNGVFNKNMFMQKYV